MVLLETHWEPVDTFHDCPTKGEGEPRLFFTKSPHSFVEGYCGVGGGGGDVEHTPAAQRKCSEGQAVPQWELSPCNRLSPEPQVVSRWTGE